LITICDNTKERCPYFPSSTQKFHQNFPDPAKAVGSEEEILKQFMVVAMMIKEYSKGFVEEQL